MHTMRLNNLKCNSSQQQDLLQLEIQIGSSLNICSLFLNKQKRLSQYSLKVSRQKQETSALRST